MASLGTIRGQIVLDAKQAIASYAAVRAANVSTVTAMNRGGAVMTRAGLGMIAAGAMIGAGFAIAINKAAEFERKMDFFGAVSGATVEQMKRVSATALQIGEDTIYSADQIAESFIELGKAGVGAEDIINGIGAAVANLGAAADIPLVAASNIIVSAVQTFGMAAQDATRVADLLTGSANASMVEVQDLGVSLKYAGGVAASIGIPFEDLNTAFALLGKYGIRGSTAGTAMRQMIVGLIGNSKQAIGVMEDLGIITEEGGNAFFDATGKLKPLPEVMQILNDSMEGLTQEDKVGLLRKIFNVRSLPTVLNLMKEGTKGFEEMNAAIEGVSAADTASARLDNLSGDLEILRGNLETMAIQVGGPMQEFFRGIVQGLTRMVQVFADLSPGTQLFILKTLAIVAGLLLFMGTITLILGIAFRFVAMMIDMVNALKLVSKIIFIVIKVFKALSVAMLTNPIGLIIIAIIALVAAFVYLWKNNEGFRNFMIDMWTKIKAAWDAVFAWFQTLPAWFANLWETIKTKTIAVWDSIVNFFTVTIPTAFSNAWNAIKTGVTDLVTVVVAWFQQLPTRISAFVSQLVTDVIAWFELLPGRLGYIIGYMVGRIIGFFINLGINVLAKSAEIINGVVEWFQKLPGRVEAFVTSMRAKAIATFNNFKAQAISTVITLINNVVTWFQKLPGRVNEFVSSMRSRAISTFNNFRAQAISTAINIINSLFNWFGQLPGRIGTYFTNLRTRAVAQLISLVSSAGTMGSRIYNGIKNWVSRIPGAVSGAIGKAIQAFKDMVRRAFSAAKDFAKGLWDGFKAGLGIKSPSFIEKSMVQITRVIDEETKNMRGQVRAVQKLGNRLTNIATLEPEKLDLVGNAGAAMVRQMAAERASLQALQDEFQLSGLNSTAYMQSRIDRDALSASQSNRDDVLQVRLSDEQLRELGRRKVEVAFTNHNPLPETSSETAVNQMTRIGALGIFG
ncbi:MAG: phage tail tape measure protein [Actinobacteria bacterium]|nr:phage tail tape measure protein [Actinomycetota bacterium]MCA1807183.1 phage tail tape measure protein [Actinomycetota bacterium]